MSEQDQERPVRRISYGESHMEIVRSGAEAVETFLLNAGDDERLNLLFCLDRYLDPYFGYNLPYAEEIFEILQREVLRDRSKEIKEDALELIRLYSSTQMETLARRIDEVESELLTEVLEVLGSSYNLEYAATIARFLEHEDPAVRGAAQGALNEIESAG
ncbi:hypothetical protein CDO73_12390 [Saccharibacillus sp. O23]|uniref:HEAT repeat domain-containing protein n=1 Tax=Saccharibacillus sp. O23 TaxID=2009338 RepID=UPI000B4E2A07|nr:hypothetical protein [Saccharibacillus sp. O23]OWR29876.1 hypothetical protein CDO73_12390 [Saccharibacillus sp. O23]